MGVFSRLGLLAAGVFAGLQASTQYVAWSYYWAPALGEGLGLCPHVMLYAPWAVIRWRMAFGAEASQVFAIAGVLLAAGPAATVAGLALLERTGSVQRRRGWGTLADARRAGLLDGGECVVGLLDGRLLTSADLRPVLVTGATRSGKGRGHVTPTLLNWRSSVLVHDPKGELQSQTAGWRASFSRILAFNPRSLVSARWNPLAEIKPGAGELGQVQRLVAVLADPSGARNEDAIWDVAASEMLEALILHVLYAAEDDDKTLLHVRSLLADLDAACETMSHTFHRLDALGRPETHPFIAAAAKGHAAMHQRFRSSVQGTARSYLKWLAGEEIERILSASDFTMGDLMCAEAPLSLYVQSAPADTSALRPLIRLIFHAATQALTANLNEDAWGRPKRRSLLMVMDEFPLLGRLEFVEKSLRLMSAYGVKPLFVAQSLNDIVETYGPHNTLLDNCAVYTAFSALDPLSQDKISRLTGQVLEVRTSRSRPDGWSAGRASISRSTLDRPLLEPGEARILPPGAQLVFAADARPLRTRKLCYDRREPFRSRARIAPPAEGEQGPPAPHPWSGRRALGHRPHDFADEASAEKGNSVYDDATAQRAWREGYAQEARNRGAQEAALDSIQGKRR